MDLIERLRAVKWEEADDCGRMPDDPAQKCVFVDMRPDEFEALLRETAAALEAAREDGWQPIETAPKDGTRVLLWYEWHDLPVVGDFRHGRWWSVHSLGGNLAHPNGMDWEEVVRPTYWRPLPAPPAIDQARGKGVADA